MPTIPLNLLAFLSESVLFEWRKGVPCRHLRPRRRHSHTARGIRPEAQFSVNENSFFYTLLGWFLLYWQLSPRSTAPCSADFIGTERGDFAKGLRSAVVA